MARGLWWDGPGRGRRDTGEEPAAEAVPAVEVSAHSRDKLKGALANVHHHFNLGEEDFDELAASLRDYIVTQGCEPNNRDFLAGLYYGKLSSALSLSEAMPPVVYADCIAKAEVCRRWLDGEQPMVSIGEMLGFDA